MHDQNIIHRDLKPGNILMNSKEKNNFDLRIADFGLATVFNPNRDLREKCGTPTYIAPEILDGFSYD